jgi:hypothetical protein
MSHRKLFFLLAIFAHSVAGPALAAELPRRVGQCAITAITKVGTRLDDTPGSGSAVSFENGGDRIHPASLSQGRRSRPCLPDHQSAHASNLDNGGFGAYVRRRLSGRHAYILQSMGQRPPSPVGNNPSATSGTAR